MTRVFIDGSAGTTGLRIHERLSGRVLEELPLEEYRRYSPLFEQDLYEAIDLNNCMEKRISEGGTSLASVEAQLCWIKEQISHDENIH